MTLIGPGGIGKTRLAIEAAARSLAAFQDGATLIPLVSVGTAELLLSALAEALGEPTGPKSAAEALTAPTDEPAKLSEAEIAELDYWFPPAAEKDFTVPKLTPDGSVTPEVVEADGKIRRSSP